jgi:polysaccharide export outer membrane protein
MKKFIPIVFLLLSCAQREILPSVVKIPKESVSVQPSLELEIGELRPASKGYAVGPGDVLKISIWNQPELSAEVTVSRNNTIVLPILGEVDVKGMGTEEIKSLLIKEYSKYLKKPSIDVTIKTYGSRFVYVLGEVKSPGAIPITREATLLEVLAVAGGPTESAYLGCAYLIRKGKAYPINLYAILKKGEIERNIYVEDGDIIYIPNMKSQAVYVVGEVGNPGPITSEEDKISLLKVLTLAGGIKKTAGNSIILVKGAPFNLEFYMINMGKGMKGKKEDILKLAGVYVEPGDIIVVSKSGIADWNETLELIKPTIDLLIMTPLDIMWKTYLIRDIMRRE